MIRTRLLPLLCCCSWLAPGHPLQAQAPATPATAPTLSLPQLETTYQAELKKIHVQLLGKYITDLQRLATTSRSSETTVAINEELRRMQAIISSGGVIDLQHAAAEAGKTNAKPAGPAAPAPPPATRALITLGPALASEILPVPAPGAALDAIPFTKIVWTIETLPRGSYELVAQCSLQSLDDAASLQLTLGREQIQFPLLPRHLASTPGDFRLLRLGRIELPLDIQGSPLELLLIPAGARADLRLRQLFITRAPPSSSPSPPPQP